MGSPLVPADGSSSPGRGSGSGVPSRPGSGHASRPRSPLAVEAELAAVRPSELIAVRMGALAVEDGFVAAETAPTRHR
eukprot:281800-Prymnesium_polylepis.1